MSKNKTCEVIRFEVIRSLKKPSFWIAAILVPVVFIAYVFIVGLTSYHAGENLAEASDTSELRLSYLDESNYLTQDEFINSKDEKQSLTHFDTKEQGIDAVKNGQTDVFYYFAPDFAESKKISVYAKPEHLTITTDYSETIKTLLRSNALTKLNQTDVAVITDGLSIENVNFDQSNHEVTLSDQISRIVAPIAMIALYELIVMTLSSRLSNAMVEEKENRISELLLTSVKPISIIVGKIISLMIIGIIQIIILLIPMILLFFLAGDKGILPENLQISLDPISVIQFVALLIASYFATTAAFVLVGVLSPTAKDCSNYAGIVIILTILPLITMNIFTDSDVSLTERIMTYLPFVGPTALAFRVIANNLETWEFFVSLFVSLIAGGGLAVIATHIFCRNSINFSLNLNFKALSKGPRTEWKSKRS